jgi:hypothetical protein
MAWKRDFAIAVGLAVVAAALLVRAAAGDIGVESVSRHGARAGGEVRLTVGCGACVHRRPPSFPVSLLPLRRARAVLDCEIRDADCPTPIRAPRRGGFRYLGDALPLPRKTGSGHSPWPRYGLEFTVPRLAPGDYAYVIWCDACVDGRGGSLITFATERRWRLRVRPAA